MFSLVTTYFKSTNRDRQNEIEECLKRNLENPLFSEVIVFAEHDIPFYDPKLKVKGLSRRPTFLEMINTDVKGIRVIANSDIYFDETLQLANKIQPNECYAISRWDWKNRGFEPYQAHDSQDVWVLTDKPQIGNYQIGMPGCDNRLLGELHELGYKTINPVLSIKCYHLHQSNYRTYTTKDTVHGQYGFATPARL